VKNTGARAGREVVQVYVRTNSEVVTMPVMELKKFTKVELQPGEERELRWELGTKELEHLDQGFRRLVEECSYEVMVGASAGDIRLRTGFSVGR
jgi:beta-glucosidase